MKSSTNYYYIFKYSSFKSTQIYNIITYKLVKIDIDNDTQKEKMIIPSFGGAEDIFVERFCYFSAFGY